MKNHRFAKTKTGKHGKQLIHSFHTMDNDRFSIMGCQQKLSLKTRKLLLHAHTANLVKTNLANGGKPAYPSRFKQALKRAVQIRKSTSPTFAYVPWVDAQRKMGIQRKIVANATIHNGIGDCILLIMSMYVEHGD